MAVAVKAHSLDSTRTDSFLGSKLRLNGITVRANPQADLAGEPLADAVFERLGQRDRATISKQTSSNDQSSEIRKLVLQGELFSSLLQDRGFGPSRAISAALSSLLGSSSTGFDDAYSKLGRWRLKGTDELLAAEIRLVSSERNLHLLAIKALDEEDVETFNHACWLLSQKPPVTAGFVTAELVKRIGSNTGLTPDQWVNGLEMLSGLPWRYLALFAPSVRNILLAAVQQKKQDVLDAAKELAESLLSESLEDRFIKSYILAKAGDAADTFVSDVHANSLSATEQ
jgi:hypothetical protein